MVQKLLLFAYFLLFFLTFIYLFGALREPLDTRIVSFMDDTSWISCFPCSHECLLTAARLRSIFSFRFQPTINKRMAKCTFTACVSRAFIGFDFPPFRDRTVYVQYTRGRGEMTMELMRVEIKLLHGYLCA